MKHLYEYNLDPLTGKKSMSFFLTFGEKKFISKYSKNISVSKNKDTEICLVTKKKTGKEYICKIVKSGKLRTNEFIIPNTIDSPRIVKINEIYQTSIKGEDLTFMMMEYNKNTLDIFDYIIEKNLISEKSIVNIMYYATLALRDVHSKGYYHGDIKFENFIIQGDDPKTIKLIDFGFSGKDKPPSSFFGGTRKYIAPEILNFRSISRASDIWSLGSVLFYFLTGETYTVKDIDNYIFSNEMKGFLKSCLKENPEERKKVDELLKCSWFDKHILNPKKVLRPMKSSEELLRQTDEMLED